MWYYVKFSVPSSGRPAESVDVHGVLLLSLLHRGQSLHWTAQVHTHTHLLGVCPVMLLLFIVCAHLFHLIVSPGSMRSTACWLHSTTQHNHHGTTPNTWVSICYRVKTVLYDMTVKSKSKPTDRIEAKLQL